MTVFLVFELGFLSWVLLKAPFLSLAITVAAALVDVKYPRLWKDKIFPVSPLLVAWFLGLSTAMVLSHTTLLLSPVIGFAAGLILSRIIKSSKNLVS